MVQEPFVGISNMTQYTNLVNSKVKITIHHNSTVDTPPEPPKLVLNMVSKEVPKESFIFFPTTLQECSLLSFGVLTASQLLYNRKTETLS